VDRLYFKNEAALSAYAARLANLVVPPCVIFLSGSLGAGKTTFVRGFLRGLGFKGRVKSPTFTLVEEYFLQNKKIYHFDFYRICDPEELECMGIRDYFDEAVLLIEWPERASAYLPTPDLTYYLEILESGRALTCQPESEVGHEILNRL
jgi:tRNA threonylcarbamoyladenosine biosynthesis protein TsaE